MGQIRDTVGVASNLSVGAGMRGQLAESVGAGRAHGLFVHGRARDWIRDPATGLLVPDLRWIDSPIFGPRGALDPACIEVIDEQESWNLITNAGRIFLHSQGYGTSGLGANGLNFIALSNDTVTETATSTVLSNEITTNGLGRAVGAVTLPTGSGNQTTIAKTFTASGSYPIAMHTNTSGTVGRLGNLIDMYMCQPASVAEGDGFGSSYQFIQLLVLLWPNPSNAIPTIA